MTPKTLNYFIRSVYGNSNAYLDRSNPDSLELAIHIERLTGRKTLLNSDIDALRGLGFEFTQVLDPKIRR